MLRERALPHPIAFIEPCLPRPAKQPPAGRDCIHEIKHDGFRIMARRADGRVRLLTRKGRLLRFSSSAPSTTPSISFGSLTPPNRPGSLNSTTINL
jgi:ATP-dependent DNA ligase